MNPVERFFFYFILFLLTFTAGVQVGMHQVLTQRHVHHLVQGE